MNHNEMTGFDLNQRTQIYAERFVPIFIFDDTDNQRITKRMETVREIYEGKGIECLSVDFIKGSHIEKIFSALILGDWIAYYIAIGNGAEPNEVPMVEDFKKKIS